MTEHRCPRCGTEPKVVEVRVPVYLDYAERQRLKLTPMILHYEAREEVADCPRCTGSY